MRVLGIDPGYATTGYAVVERSRGRLVCMAVGAIRTDASAAPADRLVELRTGLLEVIGECSPAVAVIERVFFNNNVRTAMAVGQAAGVAMEAAAGAGLAVFTYTPSEVKSSVVGVGTATKRQVQAMVTSLLRLAVAPSPPDAADACALAICHLNRRGLVSAVEAAR